MKKILFMLSSMNIGGVEKSLLSLLSVLPNNKYDVTVLLLEKKGGFLNQVPKKVKVEEVTWYKEIKPIIMQSPKKTIKDYYKNNQYFKILHFIFTYLLSKHMDNRYLFYKYIFNNVEVCKEKYDIAISYQGPTDIIDFFIANKVNANKKISWVHFDVSKHLINVKLYKKLYKNFDQIFVVSKEAKNILLKKIQTIESKTKVFLNLISTDLINIMSKSPVDFDNDYKGVKIVTVGRLSKEKGQDIAIKVLKKLRDDGYEVKWYCIGDGGARSEYEELIIKYNLSNYFILMGSKGNPYPYIARSDIYVQPSRHEGYCLTLAEAKFLKRPIVTTNFTGASDQIENGENGWIVNNEENSIYEKVKYLIDNPLKQKIFSDRLAKHSSMTTINHIDL